MSTRGVEAVIVLSQGDASRLPFDSRYPVARLVAWLVDEAGLLRPFDHLYVIDLTFGEGVFWHALRGKVVIAGVDVRILEWVVKPRWFKQVIAQSWRAWITEALNVLGGRVDLVAVDPPWQRCIRGNGCQARRKHYRASHAVGSPESILYSSMELARHLSVPLLYHWREPLDARHLAGPIAFIPYLALNPRASSYRSYFGVITW